MDAAGDGVRSCGLQLRDVEDGVYRSHRVGKAESEGVSSDLSDDRERTKELFGQLLGRAHRADVLSSDIDLISDLEVRRG